MTAQQFIFWSASKQINHMVSPGQNNGMFTNTTIHIFEYKKIFVEIVISKVAGILTGTYRNESSKINAEIILGMNVPDKVSVKKVEPSKERFPVH